MAKPQSRNKKRARRDADKRQKKRQKKQTAALPPPRARPDQPATLEDLPLELLTRIIRKMPFPQRLSVAAVSRRWREAATDARASRTVKPGMAIMDVIEIARPGDTILIPPGYYPELLLIEKSLRIVGQPEPATLERPARPVVLQSNRPVLALCNARCYFENVTMRTGAVSADRSICCFGPDCPAIIMQKCEIGGASGLLVPNSLGPRTKLILRNCYIHSVGGPMPAIAMESGSLLAHGCTITDCEVGIEILEGVRADLRYNHISFCGCGILMDGIGRITDNTLWGNSYHLQMPEQPSNGSIGHPPATPAVQRQLPEANGEAGPSNAAEGAAGPSSSSAPASAPASALPTHLRVARALEHAARQTANQGSAATPGMPPTPSTPQDLSIGEAVHQRKRAQPPDVDNAPPPVYLSNNHILNREKGSAPPRTPAQKRIRTRVRDLTRTIYGRHDDNYEDWEMIEGSDLDSEGDASDQSSDFSASSSDMDDSSDSSSGSEHDWDTDDDGAGLAHDMNDQAVLDLMGGPIPDEEADSQEDSEDDDFSASSYYSSDSSLEESSIDESSDSSDEDEAGNGHEPGLPNGNADDHIPGGSPAHD